MRKELIEIISALFLQVSRKCWK